MDWRTWLAINAVAGAMLAIIVRCYIPESPSSSSVFDVLMQRSTLLNSADAIEFGAYRIVRHDYDLIQPKWKVLLGDTELLVASQTDCLEHAFKLSEGD